MNQNQSKKLYKNFIYRPLSYQGVETIRSFMHEIDENGQYKNFYMRNLHVTLARGNSPMPTLNKHSAPESVSGEISLSVDRVHYLGKILGAATICLMLDDSQGILRNEAEYFQTLVGDSSIGRRYRPHIALARMPTEYINGDIVERINATEMFEISLASPRNSCSVDGRNMSHINLGRQILESQEGAHTTAVQNRGFPKDFLDSIRKHGD